MGRLAINPPAEAGGIPESKNPFASSRFTIWWLASMVAGTGVGIQTVTVPLFVRDRVDLEVRGLAIAAALIAQTLPGALLVLVGGAMADRAERHRILARTYSIAALVSTLYVLLSGLDVRTIWPVFPLAAIVGSAGAFTNPARQSMLPQLVTRAQLQNGVIFGTMGFIATLQFLGPTVAGLVVDSRGLTAAFGLEVVMLAAGAVLFSRLPTSPPEATGATVFGDLIEGLRYIRREPALLGLLLLGTVIGVCFIGPFSVTVPLIVPDILGATDKWVGILWGCFGAGAFLGSVALTLRPLPRRGLAVCLSILLGGVLYVLYGLSEILLLSAALQLAAGLNASVFMNYAVSLLQEHTAPRMMGRVMSMYSFAFFASMPIGYAQAGIVTSLFGPQTTLVSAGLLAAVIGLACVTLLRPVRALE
jgi:MFS family permease